MPQLAVSAQFEEDRLCALGTEAIFRAHAAEVSRWARALGGPAIDVQDVVQEVFIVVHRRLDSFRGESRLTTWLYGITSNVVHHQRRGNKGRQWLSGSAEETGGELSALTPSGADEVERHETAQQLYRVLDGMSDKYRDALILFEIEERSAEEIAELMGAKVGTVWVWLHRARADFLKRLQKIQEAEGD